jgi:lipoprotein signal peptidase
LITGFKNLYLETEMTLKHYTNRFLILTGCLVIIDLIIKTIISFQFQTTEMKEVIPGFLSMGRIETIYGVGLNLQNALVLKVGLRILFQVALLALAVRVQKLPVHRWYKYSTALIALAVIGNGIDWILFSHGRLHYIFTEYIWFHFLGPVLSISTILNFVGWLFLLISVIVAFRDLKIIFTFKKNASPSHH